MILDPWVPSNQGFFNLRTMDKGCDAAGHFGDNVYGDGFGEQICPKCGKPWKEPEKVKKIGVKDITKKNITNFATGIHKWMVRQKLEDYEYEQYIFRAFLCRPCTIRGKCDKCGCHTPYMYFSPEKMDERGNWPSFAESEEDWKLYKEGSSTYRQFNSWIKILINSGDITSNRDNRIWAILRQKELPR